ncbi:ComEC/Rec2 family competence protein [Alteriqipengyuania lutimaris]|uniref:MBL fold metallo-hydrolase n=1 Tax=Alteriqipengyuania lutimaris TaxID=1538146 RepID=A0A395LM33_9SPHN|nr:hypothetical protein [Alteriqipengyuania lutimaris]MBB3033547.1 hypothetical protein [Alteriqipengyuania lutimaris]RDS77447.1 hypothetical protein DL238_07390 [Alteriqipengyuania lutimaris]
MPGSGGRADELAEFRFYFVDMGQGDCTIIRSPTGHVYVVDCGSVGDLNAGTFTGAGTTMRAWSGGNPVTVILTHPDRDHYNQLLSLLYWGLGGNNVNADHIYFSMSNGPASPLGHYSQTALAANLGFIGNPPLTEVTINAGVQQLQTWTNANAYTAPAPPVALPAGVLELAQGPAVPGVGGHAAWSLRIVAGNVPAATATWTDVSNSASLMVVAQIGAEKVVITGDATQTTMDYVRLNHAAQVQDAEIFQVPHHGSLTGLPTAAQRNLFNPRQALISVGILTDGHKLPRFNVITAWQGAGRIGAHAQVVDYFMDSTQVLGYNTHQALAAILTGPWAPYPTLSNTSGTFHWLQNPANAGPGAANTGFYGFTNNGYFLFRQVIAQDILETGIIAGRIETWLDGL